MGSWIILFRHKKGEAMKFNLDIPKMGYNLLVRHEAGFVGNQIYKEQIRRGFSKVNSRFTHVETLGGGPFSIRVAPPLTKVVDFTKRYKGRYIRIVKYKDRGFDAKRYKIAFWAASNCNKGYDWFGVLKFRLPFLFHKLTSYFCSENSLWAIQKEFPAALGIQPFQCMPAHYTSKEFDVIWQGVLL